MKFSVSFYRQSCVTILMAVLFILPAQASMEDAMYAARNRNFDIAFKLFLTQADLGNSNAQYRLAGMYKAGQGTPKNNIEAQKWYIKAAAQGHVKAQKRLATLQKNTQSLKATEKKPEVQLLKAARKGDLATAKEILKAGANVNYQDKFGITPLMESVRSGHSEMSVFLLKSQAKTEIRSEDGDTALLIAASSNNLALVKTLIKSGADINIRNRKKCTPLILATYRNDQPMAEFLLAKGANIFVTDAKGRTAYGIAVGYKNKKLISLIKTSGGKKLARLLDGQVKVQNLKQLKTQITNNKNRGWTPVMYGAWRGDEGAVRAALSKGQDLEIKDNSGMSALALAAQGGHLQIIYSLLEAGAGLSCIGDIEKHAFYVAAKQGHENVIRRLVSALKDNVSCEKMMEATLAFSLLNGKMNIADLMLKEGVTLAHGSSISPLIIMAAKADENLILLLIRSGADVNAVNAVGESALMVAARHGNAAGIKSLIAHKADIYKKDSMGRTALILAAQNGQLFCVKYLADVGSDVLWLTKEGNTALMLAADNGYVAVVSYLSKFKNLDHKNNIGDTALIMAVRGGYYNVSEVLLKRGSNPRIRNNKREKAHTVVDTNNRNLLALLEEYETSHSWINDIF